MRVIPLTGQVLVEILPDEKQSAGGIEFPDHLASPEENQQAARRPEMPKPLQGIVREIGPWPRAKNGLMRLPEFGIGARIVIHPNAGQELRRGIGERLRLVRNEQVLAVLM
jgi:co-chaperonin GroES (HSP10)